MTIDELLARESIRQTMANYTMAGDRLRVDDFVAVFTDDAIDGYIDLKMAEVTRLRMSTHPVEYDMYYSL